MKLWILKKQEQLPPVNPWEPWYDTANGFVVRAETEEEARALAQLHGGEETRDANAWINPSLSTVEELRADGESQVIIQDFRQA